MINYPWDTCKALTILQCPTFILAFQHPVILLILRLPFTPEFACAGDTVSIDGSWKQLENGPLHKQKTLQYDVISDWMSVIVRIIIPT